ncbi:unnamed protein product [[Candida] boidinii]|nr:unnamed protein product [[Candida] boidinii]
MTVNSAVDTPSSKTQTPAPSFYIQERLDNLYDIDTKVVSLLDNLSCALNNLQEGKKDSKLLVNPNNNNNNNHNATAAIASAKIKRDEKLSKFKENCSLFYANLSDAAILLRKEIKLLDNRSSGINNNNNNNNNNNHNATAAIASAKIKRDEKLSKFKENCSLFYANLSDAAILLRKEIKLLDNRSSGINNNNNNNNNNNHNATAAIASAKIKRDEKLSKFKENCSLFYANLSDAAILLRKEIKLLDNRSSGINNNNNNNNNNNHNATAAIASAKIKRDEKLSKFKENCSLFYANLSDAAILLRKEIKLLDNRSSEKKSNC